MGTSENSNKDILGIPRKTSKGKDYVIGDLHGNRECLEAVLAQLGADDRLFIVGDLVDRGNDSPGVITLINQINATEGNPQIHCIRGNHENISLKTIEGMEAFISKKGALPPMEYFLKLTDPDPTIRRGLASAQHHMRKNGGEWLIQLFKDELESIPPKIEVGDDGITYLEGSRLLEIKNFMNDLPYVNRISDIVPFNTVHADLPLSDTNLRKMMKNKLPMTETEKTYAVWARKGTEGSDTDYKDNDRNEYSMLTLVGHNIISHDIPIVRYSTNTLDADVGAYSENAILLINVTDATATLVNIATTEPSAHLIAATKIANQHLAEQKALRPFLAAVKDAKKPEQFYKVLEEYEAQPLKTRDIVLRNATYSKAELCLIAINSGNVSRRVHQHILADEALSDKIYFTNFLANLKNVHTYDQLIAFIDTHKDSENNSIYEILNSGELPTILDNLFRENFNPAHLQPSLISALIFTQDDMLDLLLEAGLDPNNLAEDIYKNIIADDNQLTKLSALLERGLDPNKVLKDESSLLDLAILDNKLEQLKVLLAKGADIERVDIVGSTPLKDAIASKDKSILKIMVKDFIERHPKYPLHIAAKSASIDFIETILKYGELDINDAHAQTGHTPLLMAVALGNIEAASAFLEYGADANQPLLNGLTALHIAAAEGQAEMIKVLVEYGAQPAHSIALTKEGFVAIFQNASTEIQSAAKEYARRQNTEEFNVTPSTIAKVVSRGNKNSELFLSTAPKKESIENSKEKSTITCDNHPRRF